MQLGPVKRTLSTFRGEPAAMCCWFLLFWHIGQAAATPQYPPRAYNSLFLLYIPDRDIRRARRGSYTETRRAASGAWVYVLGATSLRRYLPRRAARVRPNCGARHSFRVTTTVVGIACGCALGLMVASSVPLGRREGASTVTAGLLRTHARTCTLASATPQPLRKGRWDLPRPKRSEGCRAPHPCRRPGGRAGC
jgi:hypothetical protein